MNEEVEKLLHKSRRSLAAAKTLLAKGDYDFSASRSYYAMFYAAQAVLLNLGIKTSKHSSLHNTFYHHLVKPGIFDKVLHHNLHEIYRMRQQGDYEADEIITQELAEEVLKKAENFVSQLEDYLKKHEP